jgi:hypothetical protein
MAALAVVAGLAIGRFATVDGGDTPLDGGSASQVAVAGSGSVDSLEDAVEARPDDPTAWRSLGSAYVAQAIQTSDPAFYSLAERAFDRATELAPDDPTILVGRGVLELSLHRFTEAEQLAKEATSALPGNADALGVLVDAQGGARPLRRGRRVPAGHARQPAWPPGPGPHLVPAGAARRPRRGGGCDAGGGGRRLVGHLRPGHR